MRTWDDKAVPYKIFDFNAPYTFSLDPAKSIVFTPLNCCRVAMPFKEDLDTTAEATAGLAAALRAETKPLRCAV